MRTTRRFLVLLAVAALFAGACDEFESRLLARSPGEKLYRTHCADCHGVDGSGNTPRYMGQAYADLLDDSWKHGGGDPDSMKMIIREGVFAKMPSRPELSDEEVDLIIDHVLRLRGER